MVQEQQGNNGIKTYTSIRDFGPKLKRSRDCGRDLINTFKEWNVSVGSDYSEVQKEYTRMNNQVRRKTRKNIRKKQNK